MSHPASPAPLAAPPLFGELLLKLGIATPRQVQEALALQSLTGQRLGEALISLGHVTREQLTHALADAMGVAAGVRPPLGELLVRLKYLTPEQRDAALALQASDGRRLGEILVAQGACTYQQVYEALGLQERALAEGAPAQGAQAGPQRVMVVDDSPIACAIVEHGLTQQGYEVHAFQDPYVALEQVSRVRPAVVLADLEMPGIDGIELCRRLKDGPAHALPVIILTINDAEAQRVRGLRSGADDWVHKATSMAELAARIDSVVRRSGEAERVRRMFARHASDAVVQAVLRSPDALVLSGERREVTLLFCDLHAFASQCEQLPPDRCVAVLNALLGRLAEVVLTCGGTLDKFLGAGLMAVFGAPVRREDDVLRALQAAKMMVEAVRALDSDLEAARAVDEKSAVPPLALSVGVNTGPAVVGNVGSSARLEYTCVGGPVATAQALCALAAPGEVLVGEVTRERGAAAGLGFEPQPHARLPGHAHPVPVFRVV